MALHNNFKFSTYNHYVVMHIYFTNKGTKFTTKSYKLIQFPRPTEVVLRELITFTAV